MNWALCKAQLEEPLLEILICFSLFFFVRQNRHLSPPNQHLSGQTRHLSAKTSNKKEQKKKVKKIKIGT